MNAVRIFIFGVTTFLFQNAMCQTDHTIITDYGSIHYKVFGKGEPILIINGGPGMNCEGFSSLAELLEDDHKVILYDQRGTGLSKLEVQDPTTLTIDLLVEDLETLRTHLNVEKWIILGHSFGGFVTQH